MPPGHRLGRHGDLRGLAGAGRASNLPWLVAALFLFGAAVGSVDCSVNIQAVVVERESGRPMMSGFHGLFSVGGIAGSVAVSLLLAIGASPLAATMCVVAVIIALLVVAGPRLLSRVATAEKIVFALPRGVVLSIGALCFVCFLTEWAALDWSAVFLASIGAAPAAYDGLGYTAFAGAMTVGRLAGDRIVKRLGGRLVIVGGSLCAAAGLCLATLVRPWEAAILGYALVGAGCSNIVPVLYTAVGRKTVMPEAAAVPAITSMGYAGILVGPVAIGNTVPDQTCRLNRLCRSEIIGRGQTDPPRKPPIKPSPAIVGSDLHPCLVPKAEIYRPGLNFLHQLGIDLAELSANWVSLLQNPAAYEQLETQREVAQDHHGQGHDVINRLSSHRDERRIQHHVAIYRVSRAAVERDRLSHCYPRLTDDDTQPLATDPPVQVHAVDADCCLIVQVEDFNGSFEQAEKRCVARGECAFEQCSSLRVVYG